MNSKTDSKLIHSLYDFLSDPDTFEAFLERLNDRFDHLETLSLQAPYLEDAISAQPNDSEIDHHFLRASQIFDRIGLQAAPDLDEQPPALPETATVLLDPNGVVLDANAGAVHLLNADKGSNFSTLTTDPETGRTLFDEFPRLDDNDLPELVVLLAASDTDGAHRRLFTLSKLRNGAGPVPIRLTAIDFGWNPAAGVSASYSFGLTTAELDILRGIVEGKDFAALAAERKRSLQTVRTQAKSLLRKTGARSQAGLIRLFAGITLSQKPSEQMSSQVGIQDQNDTVQFIGLADGRRLQVDTFGPESGQPIILLHGLFSGTNLTAQTLAFLHTHNLRILAPWRPGYAGSNALKKVPIASPDTHAADLVSILDHFELPTAIVAGRFTGAIYAAAAAQRHPERFSCCVLISPTPPIRHHNQLSEMNGWQKLFAYAICYFPAAIPVLVRGMHQFLFRKETRKFMEGFYVKPDADRVLRTNPEIIGIIETGVAETFRQGTGAHEADLMLTGSDWSRFLEDIKTNVLVLHGEDNPVDRVNQIRDLLDLYPALTMRTFPGQGQLFVHDRPDLIFGTVLDYASNRNS